ncbi:hypothetical protein H2200_003246 [Cladophialophora chaetospira]|uniref:Uncharacterized protein n=1 Tax=Cladophialophora chaetospira TaxID=386627 RepID=A0AA38XH26_9EURO|nr:hypothetical protein H2200_003246 [Cladophialophora chaetospira]
MADHELSYGPPSDIDSSQQVYADEFPKAIPASEWYQYPPIEAGAPKPFLQTRIGDLPMELRLNILEYVKGGTSEWTIRLNGVDQKYNRVLRGPLGACSQFRKETLSLLTTTTSFLVNESSDLIKLPREIGETGLSLIRFLRLNIDNDLRRFHEKNFPDALAMLCTDLPNLMRFQLITEYDDTSSVIQTAKHPETPGVSRHQQEVRLLLRFGAFLVTRHPNLDLLVWPSDSPSTQEFWGTTYRTYYIDVVANTLRIDPRPAVNVDVLLHPPGVSAPRSVQPDHMKDRILNATQIRRYTWRELAQVSIEELVISEDSKTSEVSEGNGHLWSVDKYGYMTAARRREKNFDNYVPVDRLIMAGRKREQKAKDVEEIEAEVAALKETGKTVEFDKDKWPIVPKAAKCSWRAGARYPGTSQPAFGPQVGLVSYFLDTAEWKERRREASDTRLFQARS